MSKPHQFCISDQRQQGLTLVEIMVALTISLVLLAGVMKVFANSKNTYRVQESLSRMQENGRFAIEFLSRDLRMADFWGCVPNIDDVTNNLDPDGAGYVDFVNDGGVNGTDGATDTLTLRGVSTARSLPVLPVFGPLSAVNFKTTPNNPLQQGDIIIISDCAAGDVFQVTNSNVGGTGTVVHNTGGGLSPGNIDGRTAKIYQGDAKIYFAREVIYTIAAGASGQPALFRNIDQSGAVELVEGVENMQVLYGEDTTNNSAPNAYRNADAVVDMNNVVSVRVIFTLISLEDNVTLQAGNNDNRLRRTFTTTVALRNRLS